MERLGLGGESRAHSSWLARAGSGSGSGSGLPSPVLSPSLRRLPIRSPIAQTQYSASAYDIRHHCSNLLSRTCAGVKCSALLCCLVSIATQHATVATTSFHPPSTGKVDNHLDTKQPERKRRLDSRDPPLPAPHAPARRPGHVSHKSASAIPTLSTINIAPFAPSPLGSPTSVRTAASSRRPSTASQRSARSWLGKSSAMASSYDGPSHGYGNLNPNTAADLLRQAMKSNSQQRYVWPFSHIRVGSLRLFTCTLPFLPRFLASSRLLSHRGTPRTAPPPARGSSATGRYLPRSNTNDVGNGPKRPAPHGHNSIRASSAERGARIR